MRPSEVPLPPAQTCTINLRSACLSGARLVLGVSGDLALLLAAFARARGLLCHHFRFHGCPNRCFASLAGALRRLADPRVTRVVRLATRVCPPTASEYIKRWRFREGGIPRLANEAGERLQTPVML